MVVVLVQEKVPDSNLILMEVVVVMNEIDFDWMDEMELVEVEQVVVLVLIA